MIFLDITLSEDEKDGFSFCEEIREEYMGNFIDQPYIVGLSGTEVNAAIEQKKQDVAMDSYLNKPASIDIIKESILKGLK